MNKIEFGDCRDTMRRWASEGVKAQMCVTSPPYFGLRSYLPDDSPDKPLEIGLEETPEQYIQRMVEVFRCVRDVLADDGTLWVNIGDSYAGAGYSNHKNTGGALLADGGKERHLSGTGFKNKDLIGIPWMLAFALRADGWYLRQDIIWHKPNPMPESVRDRCTKAHEYIFLLSKSERYFYDHEASKEPAIGAMAGNTKPTKGARAYEAGAEEHRTAAGLHKWAERQRSRADSFKREGSKREQTIPGQGYGTHRPDRDESTYDLATRNRRSVWTVATRPYKGAHFATFPPALIEPCILAGTSERGHCPKCGARWARETEPVVQVKHTGETDSQYPKGSTANRLAMLRQAAREQGMEYTGARRTTGWKPTCACGCDPVPDIVLDPFMGSGTTAAVSIQHGRQYLGCELNPEYGPLQNERIDAERDLFTEAD